MKLKPISAALVAALAAGALAACGTTAPPDDEETLLRIGLTSGAVDFKGGLTGGYENEAVYDTIIILSDDRSTPYPWLAESYEYNDEFTVLTLHIRDDVDFQSGNHLDADAIKANIDFVRDPATSSLSGFLAAIEDVVVTDEYTVEVRLSHPDDNLLTMMRISVVDPEVLLDPDNNLLEEPAGSGPYILESNSDTEYMLVRNENYWNSEEFDFDRIEMTVMPDITARTNALKSGEIDFAEIDATVGPELEASGLEIHTFHAGWQGLLLSDRRGAVVPALADVRVRQAIGMAFDRETFNETIGGRYGDPSNQIGVTSQAGTGYYLPELADELQFDPERARELLAEAGYPDGFDIDIPIFAVDKYNTYMEQALADIGIRVNFFIIQGADYATEYSPKNAAFSVYNPYWFTADMVEGGFTNYAQNIPDAETVELLDTLGRPGSDEWLEARERLTEKAFEEAWYAILAHDPWILAFDPSINAESNFDGAVHLPMIKLD